MARGTHAAAILGPELYSRLPNTRVLLVGAGGIGCELCESPLSHNSRDDIMLDIISRSYEC
jgi:ubiquitin-like 1-activating enzyme E1 B